MIAFTWFPHLDLKCPQNIALPCEESGMGMEIISNMANLLNLTIDVYKEKDENWGSVSEGYNNISWSGVMGLVYNGEFDISMPTFQMSLHRAKNFDFLYPIKSIRIVCLFIQGIQGSGHILLLIEEDQSDVASSFERGI
ncbi:unnamed protein product [Lepeophtheirus salmonis]|uniref:(salmon louse) hypothetical protein n=1 Tax=Lepeophtheirus salmonis TaxID=72036 RepID=A0A7R8H7K0_LEPSM|nr:unnamed protein product [Lepeophtheirus salmonis]CAF2920047.1 unnamed protein product [Lepeophtheirus salmonis]